MNSMIRLILYSQFRNREMTITLTAQIALKPQDLLVLFALTIRGDSAGGYAELASTTGLAASAVHASLKRAIAAKLVSAPDGKPKVRKTALKEFVLAGAKYAFPPVWGAMTRGVPTAYAAAPLNALIAKSADPVPVWPHATGTMRGMSLAPLYPSVPKAAMRDEKLYAMLALFDAVRAGNVREREAAKTLLAEYLD
jgi:hypothetical protein